MPFLRATERGRSWPPIPDVVRDPLSGTVVVVVLLLEAAWWRSQAFRAKIVYFGCVDLSPIPRRRYPAYAALSTELLKLGTSAERLTHLFDHHSTYYLFDGEPVTKPGEIQRRITHGTHGFMALTARVPLVAQ